MKFKKIVTANFVGEMVMITTRGVRAPNGGAGIPNALVAASTKSQKDKDDRIALLVSMGVPVRPSGE